MPEQSRASENDAADPVLYFDKFAAGWTSWTGSSVHFDARAALFDRLIRDCRVTAPTDLCLDLGCGNGALTRLALRAGFRAIGIDGSAQMLRVARGRVPTEAEEVSFRQERLPLSVETVGELESAAGLIVASSVIEYIDDEALFFSQCRTLLAPGGHALISFPNAISPTRRFERALGPRGPLRGTIVEVQRHQHHLDEVRDLARTANLGIEGVSYFGVPFARTLGRFVRHPPAWLATLMLVHLRRQ